LARLLYFAHLRERAGIAEEEVSLPPHVKTGRDLLKWLSKEKPEAMDILLSGKICMALDLELSPLDAEVGAAKEIALFPPMTGG